MISSRQNEAVKAIRALRARQGEHLLLEGPHLVAEALASALPIESALVTPRFAASDVGRALIGRLPRPPLEVAEELLDSLADADSPRGIVAVSRLARPGLVALPELAPGCRLYLDGIQDPGNLGAIARVAEAFGVAALLLSPGCCHPNHPRALRASAGSLLRLVAVRGAEPDAADREFGAQLLWAGLAAHGGEPIPHGPPAASWVLALGAEGPGLSAAVTQRLDRRWTIALAPPVESLNVAVAAGIVLHALRAH